MPNLLQWRLAALVSQLDDDALLARPLLLAGVSCYALGLRQLKDQLRRRVAETLKQLSPGGIYHLLPAAAPEVRTLMLEVPPLRDDVLRRQTIELPLQYAVWQHADGLVAYVPALDIAVLAEDERQLGDLLVPQLRATLSRTRATRSLRQLSALARFRELTIRPLRLKLQQPTLKEAAKERASEALADKSLLKEIATNLATEPALPLYERNAEAERLAELLTRRNPRCVLLVGRSGVGKTALVQHLARRGEQDGLGATPLWSTSGSRIVAGMTGFGMWQDRCEKLVREAQKAQAILHLGNLTELIEVGKGGGQTQGVAALLRPHLDRGAFLAIVECTPEQIAVIEREDPQLLETFAQLEIAPSSPEQTRAILHAVALERSHPRLTSNAHAALDRLHRRFATYSASPGRQLRFLRNLLDDQSRQRASDITPSEVTAAFSHETGLPHFMLDDAVPLDLEHTRAWFSERVIGQPNAVAQVVELLAAMKAQLARGGKPLASLLFIGPTGVGKTELAKSLAEFLYQDRGRMIRFDMSEYSHPAAVERLIGGAYSAQGLLTQKVRDQPFTVVLLDEFEKAHPLLFDVLLQVLGEGRMTDGLGRVTDFSNAVVIMTSNLGAETYRRGAVGFAGEANAAEFAASHFEREVRSFLRPEMFNRLDRILPFAPLDRATIARIARRELQQVAARDGLRYRDIVLTFDDAVVEQLATAGFDIRYGARPLKRAIEQQLVAPLASGINRYSGQLRLDCRVRRVDDALQTDFAPLTTSAYSEPSSSIALALEAVVTLRRHAQALLHSGILTRLRNEIERIRQEEQARLKRRKKQKLNQNYVFTPEQARLLSQEKLLDRADLLARQVIELEDESLQAFYAAQPVDAAAVEQRRSELEQQFRELLFDLPQIDGGRNKLLAIAAFGESHAAIIELLRAYRALCQPHGDTLRWYWLSLYRAERDETLATFQRTRAGRLPVGRLLSRQNQEGDERVKVIDLFDAPHDTWDQPQVDDCIGFAVQITGVRSAALLETEAGRHEFVRYDGSRDVVLVETISDRLLKYDPPADIGRRGSLSGLRQRRAYDARKEECRDELLHKVLPLRTRKIDTTLQQAVSEFLAVRLWELIEAWN